MRTSYISSGMQGLAALATMLYTRSVTAIKYQPSMEGIRTFQCGRSPTLFPPLEVVTDLDGLHGRACSKGICKIVSGGDESIYRTHTEHYL